jgi:hypothetical protein
LKLSEKANQVPENSHLFICIGIREKNGTTAWIYICESIYNVCEIGRDDIGRFFEIVNQISFLVI